MADTIFLRIVWAVALVGFGLILYWLVNRLILLRTRAKPFDLDVFQPGRPGVLYFTTPTCAPCKTIQRPALNRLRQITGDQVQVVEIDASVQPEVASRWGVLSVPTTFILDKSGRPHHVNHGVATADQLLQQLNHLK